jgi:hypothetical protein
MNTEVISVILTAIQTCIIVISAILLLYQLRQFYHNLRQDSYGKQLEFSLRINELLLHNKSVADQFYQNNMDYKNLNDAQKDFYNYLNLTFCLYERLNLLFRAKRVEKKAWEAWERWLVQSIFHLDLFKLVWKSERFSFHEDFCRYVDTKYDERMDR